MKRKKRGKLPLPLVFMYYILMLEITLTGYYIISKEWFMATGFGMATLAVRIMINDMKKAYNARRRQEKDRKDSPERK